MNREIRWWNFVKLQHVDAKITRPRSRFDRSTGLRGFRSRDGKGDEGTIAGKIAAIKLRLTSSYLYGKYGGFEVVVRFGNGCRRSETNEIIRDERYKPWNDANLSQVGEKKTVQRERERIKRISVLGRSFEAASFLDEEAFCAIHSVSREGQLIVEDKGREGNGWIIIETCGGFVADLFETRSRYIQGWCTLSSCFFFPRNF